MGIGEARKIAFAENRCAKPRLGEDHHSRGALNEVGAGARAHHQKKGIGHAPMQPDD